MKHAARSRLWLPPRSAFVGFRFPAEVIVVAVRWYLRYGLSYRDVEELLAERGIEVDHVTVFRWVQRFTPLLADAARFRRHAPGDRWFVDETYVKVNGRWRYAYRAIDQHGQVIDVLVSVRRDAAAARRFFTRALQTLRVRPSEVITDAAPVYPGVLDELIPTAWHRVEQYANNPIEADHSRLKHRLRPMRGLQTDRTAQIIIAGHAFIQNLRRGHYDLPGRDATGRSVHRTRTSHLMATADGSPRPPNGERNSASSLAYLNRLPVATLKIDRSFIRNITVDADSLAITAPIIELARSMGLATIAEGVETIEQLTLLQSLGCWAAQGFLWSPALAPEALAHLINRLPDRRFAVRLAETAVDGVRRRPVQR